MKKFIFILIASIGTSFYLSAQSVYYRSIASGNWNDATIWEIHNGTNWVATTSYPGQNPGTGTVEIWANHEVKLTESVPYSISSLNVGGAYVCECFDENYPEPVFGTLSFSAQNAVSLAVLGEVIIFGELRIDDQEGTKKHSLSIGGSLWVGDMWWDYYYYYTPTFFQTINQDDELHVIFNTTFSGSSIWSGSMSQISFQDITINGIGISNQTDIFVNGLANFINGKVNGGITFGDGATHSGASVASFVEGGVGKLGNDAFTFPIGNGGVYAPLTISAPVGQGAAVSAAYIRSNALNAGVINDPGLFSVSNCEYWGLSSDNNILDVTVNWSANSGCESSPYVTNVSEVTLARLAFGTGRWDSHSGSGIGTTTHGSVTWKGVTATGYFTLGNLRSVCNAPSVIASNITSNSATLSWSAISLAASYDLDYKPCLSNVWINAATATTSTSVDLSGLSPSICYDWRIRTNCSLSSSSYRQGQFKTHCGIPSGLSASNITTNNALLTWSPVADASFYNVQHKQSTSNTWINSVTGINSLSYTLTGLSSSTGYDWRVQANCYAANPGNYAQSSFTTGSLPLCSDVYEPNNTSSRAKAIGLETTASAMISSNADIDWFKITTPNNPNIPLRITIGNLPADYDLFVYEKNQSLVGASTNNGVLNELVNFNSNARKATYYIKVVAKNGAFNTSQCYNLLAQVSNSQNSASSKSYPANEVTDISDKELLYPNPASEFVYLNFNSATEGLVNIQIVNSIGQLVKQHPVNIIKGHNQIKIQVGDIRPGMYLLRINKGDLNLTKKFVIAR